MIEVISLPIRHVVGEHFNNLCQLELPSSAELEQEIVLVPWIVGDLIDSDPLLELIQHFLLLWGHVVYVTNQYKWLINILEMRIGILVYSWKLLTLYFWSYQLLLERLFSY